METVAKKPFYKKWWFWVVVVVVLAAIGSNMSTPQTSTSAPQAQQAPTTQQKTPTPTPKEAVVKVTATELYAAYKANEIAADDQYKGKTLEVTGIVDSIGKDILDTPYIQLEGGNSFSGVQCMLSKDESSKAASVKKGQKITLQGRGDGKALLTPIIRDCVIVQ